MYDACLYSLNADKYANFHLVNTHVRRYLRDWFQYCVKDEQKLDILLKVMFNDKIILPADVWLYLPRPKLSL